jgi:two-component system CheB/CheR fusion protein
VRIMPYRTMEDVIGGVVITFSNITVTKMLETKLREELVRLQNQLGETRD